MSQYLISQPHGLNISQWAEHDFLIITQDRKLTEWVYDAGVGGYIQNFAR